MRSSAQIKFKDLGNQQIVHSSAFSLYHDKKKGTVQYFKESDGQKTHLQDYEPLHDEFLRWEETKDSSTFGQKLYKDSEYRGELDKESNMRHGRGVTFYKTGRVYEGEWVMDKRNGVGFEVFQSGNVYRGEYRKGKVDGQGEYKWKCGDEYDGLFKQGAKHGYGIWKGIN
jgi:hypothetical protein